MSDPGIVIRGPMYLLARGDETRVARFPLRSDPATVVVPVFRTGELADACIVALKDSDLYAAQPATLSMFEMVVERLRGEGVTHVSIDDLHSSPDALVPIAAFLTAIRLG